MNKSIVAILAGALLASTGAAIAQHPAPGAASVSFARHDQPVAFDLFRGNRIFLPATVNGHPVQAMLDTGASTTTLDRAYARSIGLPEGQKIQARGAGGNVDAEIVTGVSMEIGGTRYSNLTVGVMDLGPVGRAIGRPLPVVIGRDFFNSAVISIDWKASQLRISSHEAFRPDASATALPLERNGPFNTIPVKVGSDEPVTALFDLGNGGALSLPKPYWGVRPELVHLKSAETQRGGVGGRHPARIAMVPSVTLAGQTFRSVPTVLGEGGSLHEPTQMPNVGIGLLKQFEVDLDLGRDRVYLTPRKDPPPFEHDRSGMVVDLMGDRLKVAFVSPEGPAALAGLKAGDEIVAVDGAPITPDYYRGRDWTRGPAGSSVVLKRADGSAVAVTLQDYY